MVFFACRRERLATNQPIKTMTTTVITDRAARTITINGESIPTFWEGTMVPYAMTYLKPHHVLALGHKPIKGKTYAIRGGNELVTCHGDYTGFAARLSLPALHINQADFVATTTI